jgi:hypothetical protein
MRAWTYPIVAFIFNYILLHSFHWGEYGTALGVVITVPIIAIVSLLLTYIHYQLKRKRISATVYQIAATVLIVLLSYYLFASQDRPVSIIGRMAAIHLNIDAITMNDYFFDNEYANYERIVAAKKKFSSHIPDTAYSVNITNDNDYTQLYKTYGILFFNNLPVSTDNNQTIERTTADSFKFTGNIIGDTSSFTGNKRGFIVTKQPLDSFSGRAYKRVTIMPVIKNETPDCEWWTYKVFYWLI